MAKKQWTDDQLINAVKDSKSISETVSRLGLKTFCGNRSRVKLRINQLNLDTSHFVRIYKDIPRKKLDLKSILVENSGYIYSNSLKRRLLKENLLKEECCECKITHWRGKKLSLHLDHINGVNDDNRIENLRILCPNCHSQTPTYCIGSMTSKYRQSPENKCCDCNCTIKKNHERCKECSLKHRLIINKNCKIHWPAVNDLIKMVDETSYVVVGKKLGVSDNAIRKRIKTRS